AESMKANPLGHASLWSALALRLHAAQIVIAGEQADTLHDAALRLPFPDRIVARLDGAGELPADHPASAMRAATGGQARAFICFGERCSSPVADPEALRETLAAMRA